VELKGSKYLLANSDDEKEQTNKWENRKTNREKNTNGDAADNNNSDDEKEQTDKWENRKTNRGKRMNGDAADNNNNNDDTEDFMSAS
jgi:hypothetical protein